MLTKKQIRKRLEKFLREDFYTTQKDRWIFCISADRELDEECECIEDENSYECPCICHQRIDLLVDFIHKLCEE